MTHNSDHDGDFIEGLQNALMVEAMIALFILAALTVNVGAILKVLGV